MRRRSRCFFLRSAEKDEIHRHQNQRRKKTQLLGLRTHTAYLQVHGAASPSVTKVSSFTFTLSRFEPCSGVAFNPSMISRRLDLSNRFTNCSTSSYLPSKLAEICIMLKLSLPS